MDKIKNEIISALKVDNQALAIDCLLRYVNDNKLLNILVVQSGQLHSLNTEYIKGTISFQEMRIHKNRVASHILTILNEVERLEEGFPLLSNNSEIPDSVLAMLLQNNPKIGTYVKSLIQNMNLLYSWFEIK